MFDVVDPALRARLASFDTLDLDVEYRGMWAQRRRPAMPNWIGTTRVERRVLTSEVTRAMTPPAVPPKILSSASRCGEEEPSSR
jgi:hypothetical protein